jgi:hypothetical protein
MKAIIGKIRGSFATSNTEGNAPQDVTTVEQTEAGKVDTEAELRKPSDVEDALVTEDAQHGVQTVEATTLVWTRATLATVFVLSEYPTSALSTPANLLVVCGSSTLRTDSSRTSHGLYSLTP